jgi:ectoine hydroxylase-related dioxygenase (phytanoyl-CoA dioxygenase family)
MAAQLTAEQVDFFHQNGYLLYHDQLLAEDELDDLRKIFEEHWANKGDDVRGDELDTPHFDDTRLLQFLSNPRVLDLVEGIVGPNILLWSSHFIAKEPRVGRATPWHEDSAYWSGRLSRYDKIVTVWLALDPSTRVNGCMKVVPGSHLDGGFSEYRPVEGSTHTFAKEITTITDDANVVYFELTPGECSLHDGRIVHGAEANASPMRRAGYTMRYLSADVSVIPEMNQDHRVWLVRGENVAGNNCETV